jgi:hypothetical protein
VVPGFPRLLLSAKSTRVNVDRSRAIPYSKHGVERETRLELATLTLARYASHSVFAGGRKRPLNDYFPPTSTGLNAEHTGLHADHTGVHVDHKMANPTVGRGTVPMKVRQRRDLVPRQAVTASRKADVLHLYGTGANVTHAIW